MENKKLQFLLLFFLIFIFSACENKTPKQKIPTPIENHAMSNIKNFDIENKITSFKGFHLKSDTVKFIFAGYPIQLRLPIYYDKNRYYLPITEFIHRLNGKITNNNDEFAFTLKNKKIILSSKENAYKIDNSDKFIKLKNNILLENNIMYISLFDLTKILNLKTLWNIDKKEISLFYNREKITLIDTNKNAKRPALIRLEDIAAGQRYDTSVQLEKLRIIADFLYSKRIPFHVAWIPRYIDKTKNIDNDISKTYSMYNADFVFTLDYFINKGGLIGLHGYTHQFKDEISIDGTEFNGRSNSDEKSISERLQLAINCAKDLNIPYVFFESPHYGATEYQHKIMEKYFSYIYEHFKSSKETVITKCHNNNKTVYIPTPLNYVDGKGDVNNMVGKIKHLPSEALSSFFYHPSIEFEFIKLNHTRDNYPSYEYSENSVLHQLLKIFDEEDFKFIPITDLK